MKYKFLIFCNISCSVISDIIEKKYNESQETKS